MSRLKYWVWLSCVRNVRPLVKLHLIDALGGPEEVFFAGREEYASAGVPEGEIRRLMDKSMMETERVLAACEETDTRILTVRDAAYPERLRRIPDPPAVLFLRGRLPAVDEAAVIGVVGTRHATPYGLRMAARLGSEIAAGGGVLVSGLAEGCDGAAMEAALRAGGPVIGVVGTAIDVVYPAKNRWLFREVRSRGAILSEHGPGIRTFSGDFKARNRLISGLSLGVAVAEAPVRSGTRVTADYTVAQGRDLYAVPSNLDTPAGEGYAALLRIGAQTVTSGAEILARYAEGYPPLPVDPPPAPPDMPPAPEMRARTPRTPIKNEIDKPRDIVYIDVTEKLAALPEPQRRLLQALDRPDMHADELIEATGLPAHEALAALTMLQVSGFVTQGAGRRYTRNL